MDAAMASRVFYCLIASLFGMTGPVPAARAEIAPATAPTEWSLSLSAERSVPVARFLPTTGGGPHPTVVLWHGGGWTRGAPDLLFPHARVLAENGFQCLLPRYPLAGAGRGLEECVTDARAILHALAAQADPLEIDPSRLFLLGESAGGHLAAMLATDPGGPPLAGVVLWNPVLDLRTLPWLEARHGPPPDRAAYSPITRLASDHPPTLLLHGREDTVVPVSQAEAWVEAALALGLAHRAVFFPRAPHAFALADSPSPEGPADASTALAHTLAFLRAPKQAVSRPGTFSILHAFAPATGWQPFAELSRRDGEAWAWGATHAGGPRGKGTLFRVSLESGTFETVYPMRPEDGAEPFTGLGFGPEVVRGVNKFGGPRKGGTLFSFHPGSGRFELLADFGAADGPLAWNPHAGPIEIDGHLWGTTFHGGATRWGGTVYRVPVGGGPIEIRQSFGAATGEHPTGQLLLHEGWIYGTLSDYGKDADDRRGALFRLRPDGSAFEVFHRFAGGGLGGHPYDRLVPHPDGFLLGTTFGRFADATDRGTVFAWHAATGRLETLLDFNLLPAAGGKPNGAVLVSVNGDELLLTTHGSLDPINGFPGTALRLLLGAERVEHGFARRLFVERVQVLHTFHGGGTGSTPVRTPLRVGRDLWGVTAFGHAGEADIPDQTQTGGLVYRLTLPPADPIPTPDPGEADRRNPLRLPLAALLAGLVILALLLLRFFLRPRRP
jgi:uncharacterized repeat protein (TIGR03803 family)